MRRSRERHLVAAFILVAAFGAVGNIDYADALDREAEEKLARPFRALQNNPIRPPRCPHANAAGEDLRYEVASKADLQEWRLDCIYTPGLRT